MVNLQSTDDGRFHAKNSSGAESGGHEVTDSQVRAPVLRFANVEKDGKAARRNDLGWSDPVLLSESPCLGPCPATVPKSIPRPNELNISKVRGGVYPVVILSPVYQNPSTLTEEDDDEQPTHESRGDPRTWRARGPPGGRHPHPRSRATPSPHQSQGIWSKSVRDVHSTRTQPRGPVPTRPRHRGCGHRGILSQSSI